MIYNIEWLDEARVSLDAEMEYVFAEFGRNILVKVYNDLMERVSQLQIFPRIGVRCEDLDYRGYEMRMLHVKKVSVAYAMPHQKTANCHIKKWPTATSKNGQLPHHFWLK